MPYRIRILLPAHATWIPVVGEQVVRGGAADKIELHASVPGATDFVDIEIEAVDTALDDALERIGDAAITRGGVAIDVRSGSAIVPPPSPLTTPGDDPGPVWEHLPITEPAPYDGRTVTLDVLAASRELRSGDLESGDHSSHPPLPPNGWTALRLGWDSYWASIRWIAALTLPVAALEHLVFPDLSPSARAASYSLLTAAFVFVLVRPHRRATSSPDIWVIAAATMLGCGMDAAIPRHVAFAAWPVIEPIHMTLFAVIAVGFIDGRRWNTVLRFAARRVISLFLAMLVVAIAVTPLALLHLGDNGWLIALATAPSTAAFAAFSVGIARAALSVERVEGAQERATTLLGHAGDVV